jgi:hypothetical protein
MFHGTRRTFGLCNRHLGLIYSVIDSPYDTNPYYYEVINILVNSTIRLIIMMVNMKLLIKLVHWP